MTKGESAKQNAAIYIRVSTAEQTEESQVEPCREFCEQKGYNVIGVYADHARSAYKTVRRKKYEEVMELVKKRKIKHVIVWALDRWTRRGPQELKSNIEYLATCGVQIHSVKEQWLESINLPGSIGMVVRDFFFGMIAWMAEEESKRKSERVRESKKFQSAKKKGTVGRPGLPERAKKDIIKYLKEGKTYDWIHQNVTYKIKYGKIKHVSPATISQIKKSRFRNGEGKD